MTEEERKEKEAADRIKSFLSEKRLALCAVGTQDILPEPEQYLSTEPAQEPPRDS